MGNSVTPLKATETRWGFSKLATQAETDQATATDRSVSPARLSGFLKPYSASRAYVPPELTIHNGGIYRCLAPSLGNTPPNAAFWGDPVGIPTVDPILPANCTFSPASSSGDGSAGTPFTIPAGNTASGVIGVNCFILTLTGLSAGYSVPLSDNNALANGGRFTFSNYVANASGTLITAVLFNDSPSSTAGASFTLDLRIGTTIRVTHTRNIVATTLQNPDDVIPVSVATTAAAGKTYVLTASLDLSLPASPSDGDWVDVVERSNTATCRVLGNGKTIANELNVGVTDLTLNVHLPGFRLVYDLGTDIWQVKL